jgi:hypothetical protein
MKPRNIIITLAVIVAGVFAGHFLGLYTLPFLTEEVNAISVLETTGTVNVERPPENITAREGMRLQERDTVQTASSSTAWLSLDDDKAVQLSELTALRIDYNPGAETPTPEPTPEADPGPDLANTAVGDIIKFGDYEWLVLDVQDGKALIITKEIEERCNYGSDRGDTTWATSEARERFNGVFLDLRFSDAERARIVETNVVTNDNPWFGTPGGADTVDKVFFLSIEEVVKYFGDSGMLANRPDIYTDDIYDEYNDARVAKLHSYNGNWWLRTPGKEANRAVMVYGDGHINVVGYEVRTQDGNEARPAMWITL